MKQTELWFCDYNKKYSGSEPFFYPQQEVQAAMFLEQNYPALRSELKILWEHGTENVVNTFGDYDSFDDKQFPARSWQKMVFKVWGLKNKHNCERFPFTASLLKRFPEATSCFVTKTSPHSVIRHHCGETNAHIRIHLGLNVPDALSSECGMEVGNQVTGWQNGKTFVFLDAHNHHVWNNSDTDRYVLIIDLIRPHFFSKKKFICARVIVSQIFFYLATLICIPNLQRVPPLLIDALTYTTFVPVVIITKLNNRLGLLKL